MQVRRMLAGETACPNKINQRKIWAEEELTLHAKVQGHLTEQTTKYNTVAGLEQ